MTPILTDLGTYQCSATWNSFSSLYFQSITDDLICNLSFPGEKYVHTDLDSFPILGPVVSDRKRSSNLPYVDGGSDVVTSSFKLT
jgi:hypothetical protein